MFALWYHDVWGLAYWRLAHVLWATLSQCGDVVYRRLSHSKRMAASFCREVLGIELSLGEVSQIEQTVATAVAPAVEEAAVYVQSCDLNIDETPWKERGKRRTLWTSVRSCVVLGHFSGTL